MLHTKIHPKQNDLQRLKIKCKKRQVYQTNENSKRYGGRCADGTVSQKENSTQSIRHDKRRTF